MLVDEDYKKWLLDMGFMNNYVTLLGNRYGFGMSLQFSYLQSAMRRIFGRSIMSIPIKDTATWLRVKELALMDKSMKESNEGKLIDCGSFAKYVKTRGSDVPHV
jgi:hypothetical protein